MSSHRKAVRRFHEPGDLHELTFSCHRRMPLLTNDAWRGLLAESLDRAMIEHDFRIAAFVFMPEHVHLLTYPIGPSPRIDLLLGAIKRPFSTRIKRRLQAAESPLLRTLTVRERPGIERFRFWQEGGGYDRNLNSEPAVLAAVDYLHANPVRRGLCDTAIGWRWSSARRFLDPEGPIDPALPTVVGVSRDFFTATGP